jgi:hypothetical protein
LRAPVSGAQSALGSAGFFFARRRVRLAEAILSR